MCDSDNFSQDNTDISNKVKHFEDNVLFNTENKGKIVYMLFKAEWCHNCTSFKPVFLKYREMCKTKGKDDMIMVIIDGDNAQELTREYKIEGFPTTYVYRIDEELLKNKDKKLSLYKEKIVGADLDGLAKAMKKYNGLSL